MAWEPGVGIFVAIFVWIFVDDDRDEDRDNDVATTTIGTTMNYEGKYAMFDASKIHPYALGERTNKVSLEDLLSPEAAAHSAPEVPVDVAAVVAELAREIVTRRQEDKPVILFSGAHLVKNGLSLLVVDLVRKGLVTHVAGNGATAIHDFELALIGETSEDVPDALGKGQFGMAYEFAYMNEALSIGNERQLGYGESLGRMICDEEFRADVLSRAARDGSPREFLHPDMSLLAACYVADVPFTVHVGIGTDVMDQHASFDGRAKGGCSGRDFLIYAQSVSDLAEGGVVLNVGSAVQGPEVLLKAASMAANVGRAPRGIVAADFDLREYRPAEMADESSSGYYWRDQKSIVTRVPEAFGGTGRYVCGNQKDTIPLLYRKILELL